MNLSKISILFSFTALSLLSNFHSSYAQTRIGIKAGANLSTLSIRGDDETPNRSQYNIGSQFGLDVSIGLGNKLFLQPGFMVIDKGYRQKDHGYTGYLENLKVSVTYLQIPVKLQYRPKWGAGNVILGIGAYAAYGTGGRWKATNALQVDDMILSNYGKVIFKNDLINGELGNIIYGKKYDFGADFTVGYDFANKLSVEINSQIGLANLNPELDGRNLPGSRYNRSFALSLGYTF